jgi:hypothetical protein
MIKYGIEGSRLAVRAAHTAEPCDPPRFGSILEVRNGNALLTAHARCLEHVVYNGPVGDLPKDWRDQTRAAIDELDEGWTCG